MGRALITVCFPDAEEKFTAEQMSITVDPYTKSTESQDNYIQ